MRIGYILLAHTLPNQVTRLVRRLRSDDARFFLHVDKRAPQEISEGILRGLDDAADVQPLPRHAIQWGTFSQVAAALEGVRAAIESPEKIDYAILITGQDYPLRSTGGIERRLAQADGRSLLSWWPSEGHYLERVQLWHWHRTILGRHVRLPNSRIPLKIKRPLPAGLRPFTGWAHWCLSRDALSHVIEFVDANPDVLRAYSRYAHPFESFFQTVLLNSPLAPMIINEHTHYVDWSEGRAQPRVLTVDDLDRMLASPFLFGRKFDERVDAGVLDALDEDIEAEAELKPVN
jgi:hypothetical protein